MLLQVEAAGLAGLTVLLAGPVSAALVRARWPSRAPRAALLLWQAVGLGGGLGILTAGLTLAAGSLDADWLTGVLAVPSRWSDLGLLGWLGVVLTCGVGVWLVTATAASAARVARARRAHRGRLDMVADAVRAGEPVGTDAAGVGIDVRAVDLDVRVVDHPRAVAYCVPGIRTRVVLSRGTLGALTGGELAAVLAHERAHAKGRHDLVIQPFVAWARTFPFLPTARRAVGAVSLLVEMLADDTALRRCSAGDLVGALRHLADERYAIDGPDDGDVERRLAVRARRLADPGRPLPAAARLAVYAAAVALVAIPPAILLGS